MLDIDSDADISQPLYGKFLKSLWTEMYHHEQVVEYLLNRIIIVSIKNQA